jgi:hypothetical protein
MKVIGDALGAWGADIDKQLSVFNCAEGAVECGSGAAELPPLT